MFVQIKERKEGENLEILNYFLIIFFVTCFFFPDSLNINKERCIFLILENKIWKKLRSLRMQLEVLWKLKSLFKSMKAKLTEGQLTNFFVSNFPFIVFVSFCSLKVILIEYLSI